MNESDDDDGGEYQKEDTNANENDESFTDKKEKDADIEQKTEIENKKCDMMDETGTEKHVENDAPLNLYEELFCKENDNESFNENFTRLASQMPLNGGNNADVSIYASDL